MKQFEALVPAVTLVLAVAMACILQGGVAATPTATESEQEDFSSWDHDFYVVTFAYGTVFLESRATLVSTYLEQGGQRSHFFTYDESDFTNSSFFHRNEEIFKKTTQIREKYAWIWKPYFIYKTLKQLPPNAMLLYTDSSRYHKNGFTKPLAPFAAAFRNSSVKFIPGVRLKQSTKYEMQGEQKAAYMLHEAGYRMNPSFFLKLPMLQAAYSMWKVNDEAFNFLKRWIVLALNWNIMALFVLPKGAVKRNFTAPFFWGGPKRGCKPADPLEGLLNPKRVCNTLPTRHVRVARCHTCSSGRAAAVMQRIATGRIQIWLLCSSFQFGSLREVNLMLLSAGGANSV